jgi:hypothetical protein
VEGSAVVGSVEAGCAEKDEAAGSCARGREWVAVAVLAQRERGGAAGGDDGDEVVVALEVEVWGDPERAGVVALDGSLVWLPVGAARDRVALVVDERDELVAQTVNRRVVDRAAADDVDILPTLRDELTSDRHADARRRADDRVFPTSGGSRRDKDNAGSA